MPRILALFLASLVALATPSAQQSASYDIVIRNGRVLDGMGNPWIVADVAIKDGRFVKIGRVTGTGQRELDAKGRYVSPGWIDMMDQSGAVLRTNGLAENKLRMGVTTAIGGEGGTDIGRLGGISGAFQLFDDGVHGRLLWRRKGCGNYSLYRA